MKHKKVNVLACALNPVTGEQIGNPRWEEIDLVNNKLFKDCRYLYDVKAAYESFWNASRTLQGYGEIVCVYGLKPIN